MIRQHITQLIDSDLFENAFCKDYEPSYNHVSYINANNETLNPQFLTLKDKLNRKLSDYIKMDKVNNIEYKYDEMKTFITYLNHNPLLK